MCVYMWICVYMYMSNMYPYVYIYICTYMCVYPLCWQTLAVSMAHPFLNKKLTLLPTILSSGLGFGQ